MSDINVNDKKKFIRKCPDCQSEMEYKHKGSLVAAEKLNRVCKNCVKKKISNTKKKNPTTWTNEQKLNQSKRMMGEKNPFYGKNILI
jgi:hypothetical protein